MKRYYVGCLSPNDPEALFDTETLESAEEAYEFMDKDWRDHGFGPISVDFGLGLFEVDYDGELTPAQLRYYIYYRISHNPQEKAQWYPQHSTPLVISKYTLKHPEFEEEYEEGGDIHWRPITPPESFKARILKMYREPIAGSDSFENYWDSLDDDPNTVTENLGEWNEDGSPADEVAKKIYHAE